MRAVIQAVIPSFLRIVAPRGSLFQDQVPHFSVVKMKPEALATAILAWHERLSETNIDKNRQAGYLPGPGWSSYREETVA
jgi:hypothetical protein